MEQANFTACPGTQVATYAAPTSACSGKLMERAGTAAAKSSRKSNADTEVAYIGPAISVTAPLSGAWLEMGILRWGVSSPQSIVRHGNADDVAAALGRAMAGASQAQTAPSSRSGLISQIGLLTVRPQYVFQVGADSPAYSRGEDRPAPVPARGRRDSPTESILTPGTCNEGIGCSPADPQLAAPLAGGKHPQLCGNGRH